MNTKPNQNQAFAILFFCGAISTTLLAAADVVNHAQLIKTGIKTTGKVIFSEGSLSCYYEVPPGGFMNQKECLTLGLQFTRNMSNYKSKKVDVYYKRDKPSKFVIDSPAEEWSLPVILVGISFFLFITGMRTLGYFKWLRFPELRLSRVDLFD